jgi:hypothetical protein
MSKTDKVIYKIGIAALCVVAFCLGWNKDHFDD